MKKFLTVLQFELKEYFTSKGFLIMTCLMAIIGAVGLCAPRFMDLSDFTGVGIEKQEPEEDKEQEEKDKLYLYDEAGVVIPELLQAYYPEQEWVFVQSQQEVEQAVEKREAEEGYVVTSETAYKHYVYNTEMFASENMIFEEVMRECYRISYCEKNQLNYQFALFRCCKQLDKKKYCIFL